MLIKEAGITDLKLEIAFTKSNKLLSVPLNYYYFFGQICKKYASYNIRSSEVERSVIIINTGSG